MIKKVLSKTIQLPHHPDIIIETGKLAQLADGAVTVKMGDTMLLATVVFKEEINPVVDFLPLYVDYQEKFASAGKIPGGFLRREGRLSDHEILISRLIDRAIRPLFPPNYNNETQINVFLISADPEIVPDILAALAASAALMISPVPFEGPIAEVRVARVDGQFVINPTQRVLSQADIDIIVGGSQQNILMVEGEMNEVQEADIVAAIQFAHEFIKIQCNAQKEFAAVLEVSKFEVPPSHHLIEHAQREAIWKALYPEVYSLAKQGIADKRIRQTGFKKIRKEYYRKLVQEEGLEIQLEHFNEWCYELEKQVVRDLAFQERVRLDGRKLDEIRKITIELGYIPGAHGSAVFTRGDTQSLTTVTLGTKLDEQLIDRALLNAYNRFMLHYNFPAFSTGEVKPNRGPGRREIGHGNLAMRAIKKVLPPDKENPYTIRIVSDVLSSNGSSSMATVCASSLALMDTGIAICAAVAGIAMGLLMDEKTGQYVILSDILGDEDALGDMDFKITGTERGITACQMDIKLSGLTAQVLGEALEQARLGRLHILSEMNKVITQPNPTYRKNVPRFSAISIPKNMIGALIGPGGKVIQEIQRESGATLTVEEEGGRGTVKIFASTQEGMQMAEKRVRDITAEPTLGEIYQATVKSILNFGAFVEFMPGREGLLPISEIKWERIENIETIFKKGDVVTVKLLEIDVKTGKYRLSCKALLPNPRMESTQS